MIVSIIIVVALVIVYFIYQGYKSRCPNCGFYGVNREEKEDKEVVKEHRRYLEEEGLLDWERDNYEKGIFKRNPDNHFSSQLLTCKKCGHKYERYTSEIYEDIARKQGDEYALSKYQKDNG